MRHSKKRRNGTFRLGKPGKRATRTNIKHTVHKRGGMISLAHFEWKKMLAPNVACMRKVDTNGLYAIKTVLKADVRNSFDLSTQLFAERKILIENASHPNAHLVSLWYAFHNKTRVYLATKYYPNGSLYDFLKQKRQSDTITIHQASLYAWEMFQAIKNLHGRNIVHRDIKLDNILVDTDGHIYLTDFGVAKENVLRDYTGANTICGTWPYIAPEIHNCTESGGEEYGKAVDWWSFGVLLYEIITGVTPNVQPGTACKIDVGWEERLQQRLTSITKTSDNAMLNTTKLNDFMINGLGLPSDCLPDVSVWTEPLKKNYSGNNHQVKLETLVQNEYPTTKGIIEWYRIILKNPEKIDAVVNNFSSLRILTDTTDSWMRDILTNIRTNIDDETARHLITQLLVLDPKQRMVCDEDIQAHEFFNHKEHTQPIQPSPPPSLTYIPSRLFNEAMHMNKRSFEQNEDIATCDDRDIYKEWNFNRTPEIIGGNHIKFKTRGSGNVKATKRTQSRRTTPRKAVATNTNLVY